MAIARRTNAEQQALYRAEAKRQNAKFEFEQFCTRQQRRVTATLQGHTRRILTARWGTAETDGYYVITKAGTTECSARVRREYQEQEM